MAGRVARAYHTADVPERAQRWPPTAHRRSDMPRPGQSAAWLLRQPDLMVRRSARTWRRSRTPFRRIHLLTASFVSALPTILNAHKIEATNTTRSTLFHYTLALHTSLPLIHRQCYPPKFSELIRDAKMDNACGTKHHLKIPGDFQFYSLKSSDVFLFHFQSTCI